jgi:hypothetical protein
MGHEMTPGVWGGTTEDVRLAAARADSITEIKFGSLLLLGGALTEYLSWRWTLSPASSPAARSSAAPCSAPGHCAPRARRPSPTPR